MKQRGQKQGEAEGKDELRCSLNKGSANPTGSSGARWSSRVALNQEEGSWPFHFHVDWMSAVPREREKSSSAPSSR